MIVKNLSNHNSKLKENQSNLNIVIQLGLNRTGHELPDQTETGLIF